MKKRMLSLCLVLVLILTCLPGSVWAADAQTVTIETSPVSGQAYKLGMPVQDGTTRYFAGSSESSSVTYRLAVTTDLDLAADVYLEDADGGWLLYFMDGSTKTYIHLFEWQVDTAKGSLELTTQPPTDYYTYDDELGTLICTGTAGTYYMGTYSNYTTIRASNTSYISGSNAEKVGVSQFPARLYKIEQPQVFTGTRVALEDVLSVRFTTPVMDGSVMVSVGDTQVQDITAAEKDGIMEYSIRVLAEDMLQPITATLYNANGEVTDTQVFTLSEYVAAIDEMDSERQQIKDLAQATLTYCQYTARAAGKYDGELNPLPALAEDTFDDFPMGPGNAPAGTRVFTRLTEACSLRMRLTAAYDVIIDGQPAELIQNNDHYECGVSDILPQDYGQAHSFTICQDGNTLYTGDFSVLSYIGACLDQDIGTAQQQEMLTAMYFYYAAAYDVAYPAECKDHVDDDGNELCDLCGNSVVVIIDFYAINDLHGKILDSDAQIGVDEMSTYLENARTTDDHVVLLSSGDMWQGSAESSLTDGHLVTDWMSGMGFEAMILGNHEFDWGSDRIREHKAIAQFPFLAINIYDRDTDTQVDYCDSSLMLERDGVNIGIIGAIGDCYSSISADKVADIYFKTGSELTELVKAEATALRQAGADLIIYSLHGDYDDSSTYDTALSDGYVDIVFEGHSHQTYLETDSCGVYHIQCGGDNKGGISHAEIAVNTVTDSHSITQAELVYYSVYADLEDHPIVSQLQEKYAEQLAVANEVLGTNSTARYSNELRNKLAELYYAAGVEKWGSQYDIVLGGGYLSVRSPGVLSAGDVTYSDLTTLFPFDNELVLCSISGQNLLDRFFNNSSYFIFYGDYGAQVKENIDTSATYYVVVDTYNSTYAANGLTEIERFGPDYYARDILAEYIRDGGFA